MNSVPRKLTIFLCHASEDKPKVRELYLKLINDGYDVWLDEEKLIPGSDWRKEIAKAVKVSNVVVVCLSRKSVGKEGFVQKEISFALDVAEEKPENTIFIIPAKLEKCSVPDRLSRWQWVDLYSENGYERLKKSLNFRYENLYKHKRIVKKLANESKKEVFPSLNASSVTKDIPVAVTLPSVDSKPITSSLQNVKVQSKSKNRVLVTSFFTLGSMFVVVLIFVFIIVVSYGNDLMSFFTPDMKPTSTLNVQSSPTIISITPSITPNVHNINLNEFDVLLKDFVDKGYVTSSEGETIPVDSFKQEWTQINYYQWWTIGKRVSDFVFSGHFKWSSSNSTSKLSGCGVVFGLQDNDDHYVVFLDRGGIAFFMNKGLTVYEVGETRGSGLVSFGNPAEANFALVVKDKSAYVSVDGEVTEYTLPADQSTSGDFALSLLSGTDSGYGTRCEMTDMFLFIPR